MESQNIRRGHQAPEADQMNEEYHTGDFTNEPPEAELGGLEGHSERGDKR